MQCINSYWMGLSPLAELAEVDDHLLRDVGRDVHLGPEARDAHVGRVGCDGNPALTTQAENSSSALTHTGKRN